MTERALLPSVSDSGYDLTPLTPDEREAKAAHLNDEERRILLNQGTEPPFCGGLLDNHQTGDYLCRLCDLPLFRSEDKFESGSGWPSFHSSIDRDHIVEIEDESHGMVRTEIRCARCDGHLGHVFPDGPAPTGLRFCLNSVSMYFIARDANAMP